MQILINNFPVDFELEHEKKVRDVVESVSSWARERELIFAEALLDGSSFSLDDVPDIDIEKANTLNCIVQSKSDTVISSLEEGISYCERIISFIEKAVNEDRDFEKESASIAGGMDWLAEIISSVFRLLGADASLVNYKDKSVQDYINRLKDLKQRLIKPANGKGVKRLLIEEGSIFNFVREIFKMILFSEPLKSLVMKSIDSPDVLIASLRRIKSGIGAQLENVAQTAIAYQTGRDDEGSEKLQAFIDFLYEYTRTCNQITPVFRVDFASIRIADASLEEKNNNIIKLIREMHSILENNDIISLSDILEYEIKPELENLEKYIDAVIDAVNSPSK